MGASQSRKPIPGGNPPEFVNKLYPTPAEYPIYLAWARQSPLFTQNCPSEKSGKIFDLAINILNKTILIPEKHSCKQMYKMLVDIFKAAIIIDSCPNRVKIVPSAESHYVDAYNTFVSKGCTRSRGRASVPASKLKFHHRVIDDNPPPYDYVNRVLNPEQFAITSEWAIKAFGGNCGGIDREKVLEYFTNLVDHRSISESEIKDAAITGLLIDGCFGGIEGTGVSTGALYTKIYRKYKHLA